MYAFAQKDIQRNYETIVEICNKILKLIKKISYILVDKKDKE